MTVNVITSPVLTVGFAVPPAEMLVEEIFVKPDTEYWPFSLLPTVIVQVHDFADKTVYKVLRTVLGL